MNASKPSSVRLTAAAHFITPYYSEEMLTQVIAIDYGSKDRLHEILKGILGEENFKLVQVRLPRISAYVKLSTVA